MAEWTLYEGGCLEAMRSLPENSVDAVVTDPPYGLSREPDIEEVLRHWLAGDDYRYRGGGFMGKTWDSFVPGPAVWREVCRVLKPGGHILCFAGTRTVDLMGISLRLGGFEIRDCLQWLYGSGFPKSLDVSKAIDKMAGAEREIIGNATDRRGDGTVYAIGHSGRLTSNMPITKEAKQWQGWGTALKPANEPIVLARKPIGEKTIAENVMKWGTGGINIDDCRIGTEIIKTRGGQKFPNLYGNFKECKESYHQGRFPANVILDEEAGRMLDKQHKGASRFFYCAKASKKERDMGLEDMPEVVRNDGRDETLASGNMPHNRGNVPKKNHHPTVKPIKLMEYLITLITPPNGIVLDPFAGSGTTMIAAVQKGFSVIGIEKEPEYCEIIRKRMQAAVQVALPMDA